SSRRHTIFSRDWSSDVCSSDLERQQIGEVQSVKERLPNVLVAVAWERAQIAVESIHLFHPRAETVVLQLLYHLARRGVQPLAVWIEQQHVAGEVAEVDDVGAGLTD